VIGVDALDQLTVDRTMLELDGTETKSKLGANAILAVSLANAKAAAPPSGQPLFKYLGGPNAKVLPVPMANVINGGAHSDAPIDFQEFMIVPKGLPTSPKALRAITEIFHALKSVLKKKGLSTAVGDEGGFAPKLDSAEAPSRSSCRPSRTPATSGQGYLPGPGRRLLRILRRRGKLRLQEEQRRKTLTGDEMVDFYAELVAKYPIISIEDGCAENDWATWKLLTDKLSATRSSSSATTCSSPTSSSCARALRPAWPTRSSSRSTRSAR
jgi:enolase